MSYVVYCRNMGFTPKMSHPFLTTVRVVYIFQHLKCVVFVFLASAKVVSGHGLSSHIFMDRITRHRQEVESVHFNDHIFTTLLFANGMIMLPSSNYDLQSALVQLIGMKVSTSKSKAMVIFWKMVKFCFGLIGRYQKRL